MAFIAFTVPVEAGTELSKLPVIGGTEKTPIGEMHVTAVFLGKNTPIADVLKSISVCYEVASKAKPISMAAAILTTFPPNPDWREGVPVIARVVSQDLMNFRAQLAAGLDAAGVEYSKKFPDYKPHVTLGYANKQFPAQKITPIHWECSHIIVWGGEERYESIFAGCQLGMPAPKPA